MKRTEVGWRIVRAVRNMPFGGMVRCKVGRTGSGIAREPTLVDIADYLEELSRVLEGVAEGHRQDEERGHKLEEVFRALKVVGAAIREGDL